MAVETSNRLGVLSARDSVLSQIQDRVLWLAMQMVYHANEVRENPDGLKVGGHQASSASVVTLLTALYFDFMRAGDRIFDQAPRLSGLPRHPVSAGESG